MFIYQSFLSASLIVICWCVLKIISGANCSEHWTNWKPWSLCCPQHFVSEIMPALYTFLLFNLLTSAIHTLTPPACRPALPVEAAAARALEKDTAWRWVSCRHFKEGSTRILTDCAHVQIYVCDFPSSPVCLVSFWWCGHTCVCCCAPWVSQLMCSLQQLWCCKKTLKETIDFKQGSPDAICA